MKMCSKYSFVMLVLLIAASSVFSQPTTYILLRHAEKDTSNYGSMMLNTDPPLSKAGEQRAESLVSVLSAYKPDAIYSTNYKRTKATVAAIAKKSGNTIQYYDPKKLASFADSLLQIKGKTIVIVGHSNTTPALVNLLIKENKYPALDDSVYDQFWIVTLENGRSVVEERKY